MAQVLRQSTSVDVRIGPFVDSADAVTPETGITLAAADQAEALKADGAATVDISSNTWAAVTGCDGWYDLTLASGDVDTPGDLTIVVQDASVCLPVFARFQVIEEATYDFLYASGATPIADINAEVDDVINTDAHSEPTGVPAANASLGTKIGTLFMEQRNKVTVTASKMTVFGDDDAGEYEYDVSDDATTFTKSEANAI